MCERGSSTAAFVSLIRFPVFYFFMEAYRSTSNFIDLFLQIQLKTEEKNKILKFFNPKSVGSNKEQGSNEEAKGSFDESSKANLQKKLKEELEAADDRDQLLFGDNDTKSNVNLLPHEEVTKCQNKRDYEEFSADSKPSTNKIDELQPSSRKRKGSLITTDDKQPTLLSYFGKR